MGETLSWPNADFLKRPVSESRIVATVSSNKEKKKLACTPNSWLWIFPSLPLYEHFSRPTPTPYLSHCLGSLQNEDELTVLKGAKSFEDLRRQQNSVKLHPTFHAACVARGLLEDDGEWRQCLAEASENPTSPPVCNHPSLLHSVRTWGWKAKGWKKKSDPTTLIPEPPWNVIHRSLNY